MIWYLDDHQDAIRLVTTFTILLPLAGAIGITPVGVYSRLLLKLFTTHACIRCLAGQRWHIRELVGNIGHWDTVWHPWYPPILCLAITFHWDAGFPQATDVYIRCAFRGCVPFLH
jgi:hypothetical protein